MSAIATIADDIDSRFKSLNSVPVSDVRLTRTEWSAIKQAVLSRLPMPDAEPAVKDSLTTDTAERMEALDKLTKMAQEDGLYDDPPVARKETAEREPIAWFCKTKHGNGVSYSNKFWELHPDFYQGAQEPNPNTAEREALVARISYRTENWVGALESETQRLLRDIRAYLVCGA